MLTLAFVACSDRAMGGTADGGGATSVDGGGSAGDAGSTSSFGANVVSGGVEFRVWAPHAHRASVEGDFPARRVAMNAEDGGVFSVLVPGARAGTTYRFALDASSQSLTRTDPYCRQLARQGACAVVDPAAYAWNDSRFSRPSRNESVVYELHVGSFAVADGAASGTLSQARARLAELAELGVNVVELMPVHAFGGNPNGWGYNPQLYLAPKPSYGTADDLRAFVDEAHARQIAVWLDVVFNHYEDWRGAPLWCFDGDCPDGGAGVYFFPAGEFARTPWGPRPNYPEPQVAAMVQRSVQQWLVEFHGDGFRWDSTANIRALDGNGVVPGGRELLVTANEFTHAAGGTTVAEDLKGADALTRPASSGGFGFDAQWDAFGYEVANVLVPESDDHRDLGTVERLLRGSYAGDPFARLLFTEDHDTVGNGGARLPSRIDPANPESFAARRRSMLAAVLLLTTPGVPMIFMGQEHLATLTFPDPPPPLGAPTPTGAKIRAFYRDLIALRRNQGGGSGGLLEPAVDVLHRHDLNKLLAYWRHGPSGEDVLVVLNFRNRAYARYDIGVPRSGAWRVRLDTDWTAYGDDFGGGISTAAISPLSQPRDGQPFTLPLQLGAYGALVLSR